MPPKAGRPAVRNGRTEVQNQGAKQARPGEAFSGVPVKQVSKTPFGLRLWTVTTAWSKVISHAHPAHKPTRVC